MKHAASKALRFVLAAAALWGACYAAVFALASFEFTRDTARSVATAVRLVPFNGRYLARLAAWQPAQKKGLLERALALNPFDFESWIQLGYVAEFEQHEFRTAEADYLHAYAVNHMFLTRWTLANFYFRRDDPAKFFPWSERALAVTPYQADPIFTALWDMTSDAAAIARFIPERTLVLAQYVDFLSRSQRLEAVPPIVVRLLLSTQADGHLDPNLCNRLLEIDDQLLDSGHLGGALQVWQSLARAGAVGVPPPSFASPVTNGDFAQPFEGHGFDWRLLTVAGVGLSSNDANRTGLSLEFSGDEPEQCELIRQYLPLVPNRTYRLQWIASSPNLTFPSGLFWRISAVFADKHQLDLQGIDVLSPSGSNWQFQTPAGGSVYVLSLQYRRPLGKQHAVGTLNLTQITAREK